VIITDIGDKITKNQKWDLDYFKRKCNNVPVTPLHFNPSSKVWGKLVESESCPLNDFFDHFARSQNYPINADPTDYLYLHDWHLPLYCPAALENFVVPKYFSGDFLQRISSEFNGNRVIYVDEWPSLFVGPKNSQSAMHVDSFGSNFWMYLLSGRKKWHLFSPSAKSFLYEDRAARIFEVDTFNLDTKKFPLSTRPHVYECILEEGEVLFVPAGSPHQVINMEDTIAISMNYIDISNIELALNEIARQDRAGDIASRELYQLLSAVNYNENMQLQDLSWHYFKTR